MASQTLCTKLPLGNRDLNSVPPMSFISLKHGNISEQQPSTFVPLFFSSLPAVSTGTRTCFFCDTCFLKIPVLSFHASDLPPKLKLDELFGCLGYVYTCRSYLLCVSAEHCGICVCINILILLVFFKPRGDLELPSI